jgi:Ca2+-binding RTX toxin-like protein
MNARTQTPIEALETRRLLSSAVLGTDGVLRVVGDDLKTNVITVTNSSDGLSLDVTVASTNSMGVTKTLSRSFLKSNGISSIWVSGGSKADTITASGNNGAANLPVRVDGRLGDDRITTGSGEDLVYGGAGNDTIGTGSGNDRIFAGAGNDTVNAGNGDDRVSGGLGNDTLNGDNNNDFIRGDAGDDTIHGGNGDDLLYGCGAKDTLFGDADNDTLWGCGGDDILWGGAGNDTLGGVLGNNSVRGEGGIDTFVARNLTGQPNDYAAGTDIMATTVPATEGAPMPVV